MKNYVVKFESVDAATYYKDGIASITYWVIVEVSESGCVIASGKTIDEFFSTITPMCARFTIIDLNFYGHFLLYWLYTHGYKFNRKLDKSRTFDVWINDVGIWYSIRTVHRKRNKKRDYAEFVDAEHKLIVDASELPKAFGLSVNIATPEGQAKATAQALYKLQRAGMRGITLSADCFHDYLYSFGVKAYKTHFPELPDKVNDFVQQAYTGGYNYINPKYINKVIRASSYDVHSMYSDVMLRAFLPHGEPYAYRGEPPQNMLFVHELTASFKLKPGMLPTVKLRDRLDVGTDYLIEQNEPIDMVFTSVDYDLFLSHYDIITIEHIGGYAFKGYFGLFDEYVTHWYDVKRHTNDPAQRTIAKHHLNHLYGVFGRSKTRKCKTPNYADDKITWQIGITQGRTGYMPLAAFVTAYARLRIINTAQANFDRFICACTDSVKLEYKPDITPIDIRISEEIGDYKEEYTNAPFKILKTNTYAYIKDGELNITASGMTAAARKQITDISQFVYDLTVKNIISIPVRGGAIKIRQDLILSP